MTKKKTKTTFHDMDNKPFSVGDRVELSPAMDLWMRGAKYGVVVRERNGNPCVRMDHPQVKKLVCALPDYLKKVR